MPPPSRKYLRYLEFKKNKSREIPRKTKNKKGRKKIDGEMLRRAFELKAILRLFGSFFFNINGFV